MVDAAKKNKNISNIKILNKDIVKINYQLKLIL